ncbi:MAG: hypothetical protein L0Y66_10835 [Myxococcaceae bacterium]|nr:hypothetical protein [Myxococcaceae bacterium]MCI0669683.1 hypothetical protein [Myxococcaceae bacterium]
MATDVMGGPTRTGLGSGPSAARGVGARVVNLGLGVWLFLSAFLWPHTPASRTNTLMVGALAVTFGLWALRAPMARFLQTTLSLWLFFSTLALFPIGRTTLWNNLVVSVLMFVASLIPGRSTGPRARAPRSAGA